MPVGEYSVKHLNSGSIFDIFTEKFRFILSSDVMMNGMSLRNLKAILIRKTWQVREMHRAVLLVFGPSLAFAISFVLEIDTLVKELVPDRLCTSSNIPISHDRFFHGCDSWNSRVLRSSSRVAFAC